MLPFHYNNGIGRGSEGNPPLITEHLRNLDQELELLKRKREMIEQQQSLLTQQQAFNIKSFNFEQPQPFNQPYVEGPRFSSHASNSKRDYSSSISEFTPQYNKQQSQDVFPRQSATKRFGDKVWSDPPVKRPFDGPANKFTGPTNKFIGPANKFAGPTNKFAGPTNKFAGPTNTFAGPTNTFAGPTNTFAGPTNTFAGPTNTFAGPTNTFAGQTNTFAGPTNTFAGPTNTFAGQTNTFAGPTNTFAGPTNTFAGPTNTFAGPTNTFAGPTNTFAGPSNTFASGPPNKFASGPPNKFGSGPNPTQSNKTQPSTLTPSQLFTAARRPKPVDFKPTKVSKTPKTKNVTKDQGTKPILLADRTPTPQTAGRLELALGNILKVIKDKYSKDPLCDQFFLQHGAGKAMKKEIRDRIYKVMVGKPVGHVLEIIKQYRKVYPDETDMEIVEIGMKNKPVQDMKFRMVSDQDTINPYLFFKKNFSRLLTHSVVKIFDKIVTLSEEEALRIEKQKAGSTASKSSNVKAPAEGTKTESSGSHDAETPTEDKIPCEPQKQEVTETNVEHEKEENKGGESVCQELGGVDVNNEHKEGVDVSKEHKDEVDVSKEYKDVVDVSKEYKDDMDVSQEHKGGEDVSQGHKDGENLDESMEEDAIADDSEIADEKISLLRQNTKFPIAAVRAQYEQMINELLPQKLAFWLPKLKWQVTRALQADLEFNTVREQLVDETVALINKAQNLEKSATEAETTSGDAEKAADVKKLKYYVKVQGRPTLPNKKLMQPFLNQFKPEVVKRIKSVRNVLFVGFDKKEDFDRIVAANGTVVGTDKIFVKISTFMARDELNAPSEATSTPNTSTVSDGDTMNDADEELNTALVNQIDELLTSIRNEEADNEDGENTNVDENRHNGEGNANIDGKRDNGEGTNQDNPNVDEAAQNNEDNGNINENVENREENVDEHETAEYNADNFNEDKNVKNIGGGAKEAEKPNENEASSNESEVQESTENYERKKFETGAKSTENSDQNVETGAKSTENIDEHMETEAESAENSNQHMETELQSTENINQNNETEANLTENSGQNIESEAKDKVEELNSGAKETVRATPTRASTRRNANTPTKPTNVRTRRANRLAQN